MSHRGIPGSELIYVLGDLLWALVKTEVIEEHEYYRIDADYHWGSKLKEWGHDVYGD